MDKRKVMLLIAGSILMAGVAVGLWNRFFSPTRIAFVNYQAINLGQIARANDNSFVKIEELPVDDLGRAGRFDMVFVNGMGLRITGEQRQMLLDAAESGTPVLTTAATNPQNLIVSVDSTEADVLGRYLTGGRSNYRNMLRYVRKYIDGKSAFADEPGEPAVSASSLLYYPSDGENIGFASVAEFESYLKKLGRWSDTAPRVILTGQMGVPDSLVVSLERSGKTVYPVASIQPFIAGGHADSVAASAVINMAHGRLGDMAVGYLRRNNIPLFAPVNANRDYDGWMADRQGMSGGFLSQSVVMPEIDGAVRPYTLFAHYEGPDGLPYADAIPGRLEEFVETVGNYLALQRKANRDKRVAIFYFKGPGQNALVAEGMEVAPSLYNLLCRMRDEGYDVGRLPDTAADFERLMNENGKVFNQYAAGAREEFVKNVNTQAISAESYDEWCGKAFSAEMREAIDAVDGAFPGHGLRDDSGSLALARIPLGNIVLIPQTAAGLGDDDFKNVHGTDAAPPHNYVAAYLWARYGFGADALVHFGAHGSLECTPGKQVALGSSDWPDRLVGTMPHLYVYSTSNVGEAMIAKRRSYAGIVNYLTPPFMESNLRGVYKNLTEAIDDYNKAKTGEDSARCARLVKKYTVDLGINRELRLDSLSGRDYTADDIMRIENFADELVNSKITGASYVLGQPYSPTHIKSTVRAMTVDPIAYSLFKLDGAKGRVEPYRAKACAIVDKLMDRGPADDSEICVMTGIAESDLDSARSIMRRIDGPKDMMERMMMMKAGRQGYGRKEPTAPEIEFATATRELERAIGNVDTYRRALTASPENELKSILNGLAGGYIAPTSGGDPVLNPDILPTGRNMYAVNAEETPSAVAWEKGKALAESTIEMYRKNHGDLIPRKVSYTLWSSEFVETGGATIAQVLHMLGVEPVRDPFGRVTDLRLVPSEELGRPRIDVVVQTSGQLRDLAASRLYLIERAVKMAAAADDRSYPNYVADGVVESERILVDRGVAPEEARKLSTARVFGGVDGNYGSGIQGMVEAGDRWDDESEIAETYIANMGAMYGSEEDWEKMHEFAFEAALARTDVVVQPRQSNTWGALSLDHVYEFMGGMDLAVRNVTGKDPEAYLSDYRNRNNVKMQEVKEAIGVESRTTILNPTYIKEKMSGGAGDASGIAETVRNTYGWNVMKPDAIDDELWDDIYSTYIADKHKIGTVDYFKAVNPAAIEEMTAVMLETVRKGMWEASAEQVEELASLHAEVLEESGASCSDFVCDNAKLREFIASKLPAEKARGYNRTVAAIRAENISGDNEGMVMKKEELEGDNATVNKVSGSVIAVVTVLALVVVFAIMRRRKKKEK